MSRRVARWVCRVFGHSLGGLVPSIGMNVYGCHRCGVLVAFSRSPRAWWR